MVTMFMTSDALTFESREKGLVRLLSNLLQADDEEGSRPPASASAPRQNGLCCSWKAAQGIWNVRSGPNLPADKEESKLPGDWQRDTSSL